MNSLLSVTEHTADGKCFYWRCNHSNSSSNFRNNATSTALYDVTDNFFRQVAPTTSIVGLSIGVFCAGALSAISVVAVYAQFRKWRTKREQRLNVEAGLDNPHESQRLTSWMGIFRHLTFKYYSNLCRRGFRHEQFGINWNMCHSIALSIFHSDSMTNIAPI